MSLQRDQKKKTWPSCISGFVQFITVMKGMTAIEEVYHQRARKLMQVMSKQYKGRTAETDWKYWIGKVLASVEISRRSILFQIVEPGVTWLWWWMESCTLVLKWRMILMVTIQLLKIIFFLLHSSHSNDRMLDPIAKTSHSSKTDLKGPFQWSTSAHTCVCPCSTHVWCTLSDYWILHENNAILLYLIVTTYTVLLQNSVIGFLLTKLGFRIVFAKLTESLHVNMLITIAYFISRNSEERKTVLVKSKIEQHDKVK